MPDLFSQKFDGIPVSSYETKFSGAFECDPVDATNLKIDDEAYFLIRGRLKGAAVSETKTSDLKRTNIFAVSEGIRIDNDTGMKIAVSQLVQPMLSADKTDQAD